TVWLRAEMVLIIPLLIVAAVFLKRLTKPIRLRTLIHFCFISFLLLMAAITVRIHFVHGLALSPSSEVPHRGALNWTKTWFSTENNAFKNFLNSKRYLRAGVRDFPDYAFADDFERKEIAKAFDLIKARKTYDREIDRIFQGVADKRSRENYLI